ncbi:MAG: Glu/Leu/Phe/Val family dehydrogenase [Flavobacteriales bacterium]
MSATTIISAEKQESTGVIGNMLLGGHEQVVHFHDAATGLKAIVAIHNTVLGPALGGTRMWIYQNEAEALTDVLRLSRGMTYKAAVTGLNLGGGKAVIIGDARTQKSEALMRRFGKFIDSLSGKYITAEDVGVSTKDMEYIAMETNHVTGLPESMGGGGDPSPVTAYGVYLGMKASAKERYGNDSLSGKKILVQGVGKVGFHLVEYLVKENAHVFVNDIRNENVDRAVKLSSNVKFAEAEQMFDLDIDIYAPCALGGTVNDNSLSRLKCSIIAGAANNQLLDEIIHGKMVMEKGILLAPDFLINAGGLINVSLELEGYDRDRAYHRTEGIYEVTLEIFKQAKEKNIPTIEAAKQVAERRIEQIGNINKTL